MRKNILTSIVLLSVTLTPSLALAANLVPCGGTGQNACGFWDLLVLANNVIKFTLEYIAIPLAICLFTYAGWLFMTSGENPSNRSKAKTILIDTVVGFIIALAAYLIVKTILSGLGYNGESFL